MEPGRLARTRYAERRFRVMAPAPVAPLDYEALYDLLDRAARARWLSMTMTDERTSRVLEQVAAELDDQINRMAADIVATTKRPGRPRP